MVTLKPYQQQVLDELEFFPSIALFMGTGSGKTYTSLFRCIENQTKHLLIICPARVTDQWANSMEELQMPYTLVVFKNHSTAKQRNSQLKETDFSSRRVVIVSLEIVAKLQSLLGLINNDWTIIVDESHRIKELGTKRSPVQVTHMALKLGVKTNFKIILTATPTQKINGGYIDYYAQLRFLGYITMSERDFKKRYCVEQQMQLVGQPYPIKVIVGYKNTDELDKLLSLVARRYVPKFTDGEPEFIKIELPKPTSYNVLQSQRAYENLNLESVSAMRIAKKTLTSGVVMGHDDATQAQVYYEDNTIKRDWVKGFLADTDETVVIFYKYNVELQQLKDVCDKLHKKYIVINGANNHKIEDIKNREYDVVLGQYNACGESIDGLQYRSHIVVYYAMPESSLEYVQSLGRINRIGQEKLPMYYHLVMKGTIDSQIYEMTNKKVEFNEEILNKITI